MAQKVTVVLVDDLDDGPADETVSFSLDGVAYEIDLSDANAATLREVLAPYLGVARRAGGRGVARTAGVRGRRRGSRGGNQTADIREWARSNGFQVNERGRIAANVVEAYEKAH